MEELEVFFWEEFKNGESAIESEHRRREKVNLWLLILPSGSSSFSLFKVANNLREVKRSRDQYLSAIHFFIHDWNREVNVILKKCGMCFQIGIISYSQSQRFNQWVLKHLFPIISTFKIIIITIIIILIIIYNPDVDECQSDALNECEPNALCTNTEGSYICRCLRGFEGDGRQCIGKLRPSSAFTFLMSHVHIINNYSTSARWLWDGW